MADHVQGVNEEDTSDSSADQDSIELGKAARLYAWGLPASIGARGDGSLRLKR